MRRVHGGGIERAAEWGEQRRVESLAGVPTAKRNADGPHQEVLDAGGQIFGRRDFVGVVFVLRA